MKLIVTNSLASLLSVFARAARPAGMLLATFGVAASLSPALAASGPLDCKAISPKNKVALVELYTSEGCSSCPPADRWLSDLSGSGLGSDRVLALALHVDYWDYIGWKDPFADPDFTKRQREHGIRNRLRSIYTPQVVLDGRDFPAWWQANSFINTVEKINGSTAPVRIEVSGQWMPTGDAQASVHVKAMPVGTGSQSLSGARLHVALFEDSLQSKVLRGENAGESLKHEKVVRRWLSPVKIDADGKAVLTKAVSLPSDSKPSKMGIAAFAQSRDGEIVQAVSCQFMAAS